MRKRLNLRPPQKPLRKFKNSSDKELISLIETTTKSFGELPMRLIKNRFLIISSLIGLFISTNAFSQTQSFRCNFSDGFSTNWDSGKPSSVRDGRMSEMVFDQLDTKKGSGRMIGNAGAETVQVLKGDGSLHIAERTPTGNMNFTTIFYANPKNTNEFPVVHSRHINLLNAPLTSQFVGLCKKLN